MRSRRRIKQRSVKKEVDSGTLSQSVDFVFHEYSKTGSNISSFGSSLGHQIQRIETEKTMKSEHIIMNEINAHLWDRALLTSLGDICMNSFPHYQIVQKWINFTLTASSIDIGMLTNFFTRLISFHHADTAKMQKYYWSILNDKYVLLNGVKEEEGNIFWCLIEALKNCLENEDCLEGFKEEYFPDLKSKEREILELVKSINDKASDDYLEFILGSRKLSLGCFDSVSPTEKVQRILVVLNFICDVLESDLFYRKQIGEGSKCFLSELLWRSDEEFGSINSCVKEIIELYKIFLKVEHKFQAVHKKLLVLVADVIRSADSSCYPVYPFLGKYSNALAREFWLRFMENFRENVMIIRSLKPHWLRLLICSKLLSHMTGRVCSPDLTSVHDVLASLTKLGDRKNGTPSKERKFPKLCLSDSGVPWDMNKDQESESCCSLCKLNYPGRSKNLRSSEMNLNQADDNGWAAIHRAVLRNHEECVKELLPHRPTSGKAKNIDIRMKGFMDFTPLMCAVVKDRPKICRMLLEDSGSVLLDDMDVHGHTPIDLCQSSEVLDILNTFAKSDVKRELSPQDLEFVFDLCAQLVESYFIIHRTWDVYRCMRADRSGERKPANVSYNYVRYEEDIHINIGRLLSLLTELRGSKNVSNFVNVLISLLTIEKI